MFLGLVQGMVTGMRGLCNGLGPAMFGVIFYLFHVNLNEGGTTGSDDRDNGTVGHSDIMPQVTLYFLKTQNILSRIDLCSMNVYITCLAVSSATCPGPLTVLSSHPQHSAMKAVFIRT